MPQSINDLTPQILALNKPDSPYVIKVQENQIIGTWNILDAKWLGLLSANRADKDYTITVKLDEVNHQFNYSEKSGESQSRIGLSPEGSFSFGTNKSFFQGKEFGVHETGIKIRFGMKNKDQPT